MAGGCIQEHKNAGVHNLLKQLLRLLAIAAITFKETVRHPLFWVALSAASLFLLVSANLALFSFGEEDRLMFDTGIAIVTVSGMIIAVFYASSAFFGGGDENGAAAALLCKTVDRGGFIVGKLIGAAFAVFVMDTLLALVFAAILAIFGEGDGRDVEGRSLGIYRFLRLFDVRLLLATSLAFFQTMVVLTISTFLATRVRAFANVCVCMVVYVAGHLADGASRLCAESDGATRVLLKGLLSVVPHLHFFDASAVGAVISADYAMSYLLLVAAYALCYCCLFATLSVMSFQRKDIT